METTELFLQPVIQYGFLGFSVVLLGVVIWLIKRLLSVLDANNKIIAANTQAINDLTKMTGDLLKLNRSVHDKLLSRPCIAELERKSG
jgi:cell division protein FtsB